MLIFCFFARARRQLTVLTVEYVIDSVVDFEVDLEVDLEVDFEVDSSWIFQENIKGFGDLLKKNSLYKELDFFLQN